jgi:hypothetical protein
MSNMQRKFIPEAEKIWHKDFQGDYYRGVIIDAENNIVERYRELRPNYDAAKSDAEKKIALSPLYAKQTTPEMQAKLEEYKRQKAMEDMWNQVVIFEPKEWNQWKYLFDQGLYRFRYQNQKSASSIWIATKSRTPLGPVVASHIDRAGEEETAFYLSRVESESDIEKLPGHKDIWRIDNVLSITQKRNQDSKVKIQYTVYGNLRMDFRNHPKTKTIIIKRKWPFYNELMEYFRKFRDQ